MVINHILYVEQSDASNKNVLVRNTLSSDLAKNAQVDVALVVSMIEARSTLQINYNALKIPDVQAKRIPQTFQDIAFRVSFDPNQLVGSMNLLSTWDKE
ncbi:MAG: hypothetical protein Q9187_004492 [Circinaria calcarea]